MNPSLPYRRPAQPGAGASFDYLKLNQVEEEAMIDFLQRLVRTPSYSTQEGELAQLIQEELAQIGVKEVHRDKVGNILAVIDHGEGPVLLVDAHMDTVRPASAEWPFHPFEAVIEEGSLFGLGSCDNKGAIAALVYALKRLVDIQIDLHGKLIVTFVVQEEPCEGCSLKVAMGELGIKPDWVLLCEPTNLNVLHGQRGRVLFKVTVSGKSSHASDPVRGENAVVAAARLIFGVDLLSVDMIEDPMLGPGTIAVTQIESRSASLNAIPDSCTFYVDRRLTLGETPARARTEIEGAVMREGVNAEIEIVEYTANSYTGYQIRSLEAFNAWALDPTHPYVQSIRAIVESVIGREPELGHWRLSTDGVYSMAEAGIPTVGFGPGDLSCAHSTQEHIHLEDVTVAAHAYGRIITTLLGRSGR